MPAWIGLLAGLAGAVGVVLAWYAHRERPEVADPAASRGDAVSVESFTCPACTSVIVGRQLVNDGYCPHCHDFTAPSQLPWGLVGRWDGTVRATCYLCQWWSAALPTRTEAVSRMRAHLITEGHRRAVVGRPDRNYQS